MVQIYIKLSNDTDAELAEWSIIEIQGDLVIEGGQSLSNKFMGDLHFTKEGVPVLFIGNHVLHGKMMKLEKPMVVLKKSTNATTKISVEDEVETLRGSEANTADVSLENVSLEERTPDEDTCNTNYLVHAIIRRKILFNKRPRAIVSSDNAKKIKLF